MGLFKKKSTDKLRPPVDLTTDMHSHLLPDLDDGSSNFQESLDMIRQFQQMGFKKLITTPHIMGDFYKNSKDNILPKLKELRALLAEENIPIEIEAGAEYYMDEWLENKLERPEELLTFGNDYLLFETSYINRPSRLFEIIFKMKTLGLKPILAHPERYTYLYSGFDKFQELYDRGVLFQININSLSGYYSKAAKKYAEKLVDNNMVNFAGSDCHRMNHLNVLEKSVKTRYYKKLLSCELLNNTL